MTIIVTPGGSDSNSYATLAEANAYHSTRLHNSAWTNANDTTKEAALLWATRTLDSNMCWKGRKATEEQALDWPRYAVYDKDGYYIDSDVIPQQVKDAQSELAFLLIEKDRIVANECPTPGVDSLKVGSLSFSFNDKKRTNALSNSVVSLVQEFGDFCGAGKVSGSSIIMTCRV